MRVLLLPERDMSVSLLVKLKLSQAETKEKWAFVTAFWIQPQST
jgi:hypothetical protein